MAKVVTIEEARRQVQHQERARELRQAMVALYDETPEGERDDGFRERIVILWRMLTAELEAADRLGQ